MTTEKTNQSKDVETDRDIANTEAATETETETGT
jgi:hypothetical protein